MHCLLCHEKIPRLRVWRTKSEFCCEEHAALYKKQTLERLLVDPAGNQYGGQASLPEPPEPEEFEPDELEAAASPAEPAKAAAAHEDDRFWERFDRAEQAKQGSVELPPPADEQEGQGIDELWRLADEVGQEGRGRAFGGGGVSRQSAEEALDALRQLANRAAGGETPPPDKPKVFEMPGRSDFEQAPERGGTVPGAAEPLARETPAAETKDSPARSGQSHVSEEPEGDSILERLMTDPLQSWKQAMTSPEIDDAGEVEEQRSMLAAGDPAEIGKAPVDSLTANLAQLDLDAPEPDWELDDASWELNALTASLAGSGVPPVAFEQRAQQPEELDVSPVEPDWEELAALDLSDADIEPPEPELEDGAPAADAAKVLAFPQPPDAADTRAPAPPAAAQASHFRGARTRFRPVLELVEIELHLAEDAMGEGLQVDTEAELSVTGVDAQRYSMPGGPAAIGPRANSIRGRDAVLAADVPAAGTTSLAAPRGLLQPDEIAPPRRGLFFPSATGAASGQAADLNMHESSVEIEPAAMLDAPESNGYVPAGAHGPFEPGGLFFDMMPAGAAEDLSGEADEQEAGVAGAAAGPHRGNR